MARSSKNVQTYTEQNGSQFKLRDRHKSFICQCLAELKGLKETTLMFQREFETDIEASGVWDTRAFDQWLYGQVNYFRNNPGLHRKWKTLLVDLHEEWKNGISSLVLSHKRARVEELQKEYFAIEDSVPDKVLEVLEPQIDPETGEQKLDKDGKLLYSKSHLVVEKRNTDGKVRVLEQIRKEVDEPQSPLSVEVKHSGSVELSFDELADFILRERTGVIDDR